MAGEDRGVYVLIDGVLIPAATVPGPKGNPGAQGDPGDPGNQGMAAVGVIVSPDPPPNPAVGTVWIDTTGT